MGRTKRKQTEEPKIIARLHTSDSLQPSIGNVNVDIETFTSYDVAYAAYEEVMDERKRTKKPHLIELEFLGGIHLVCYDGQGVETIPNKILCSVRDLAKPADCADCKSVVAAAKATEGTQA